MELNDEEQRYFDEFYEEVYTEMENKYGAVNEIHVCENIAEHMVGNVSLCKYSSNLFRPMSSFTAKKMPRKRRKTWTIVGSMANLFTLNYRQ